MPPSLLTRAPPEPSARAPDQVLSLARLRSGTAVAHAGADDAGDGLGDRQAAAVDLDGRAAGDGRARRSWRPGRCVRVHAQRHRWSAWSRPHTCCVAARTSVPVPVLVSVLAAGDDAGHGQGHRRIDVERAGAGQGHAAVGCEAERGRRLERAAAERQLVATGSSRRRAQGCIAADRQDAGGTASSCR